MRILTTTPNYTSSIECSINDGLLSLGHKVYTTGTQPINYAEPPTIFGDYDLWIMADTDNKPLLSEQYYNRPGERVTKIICHCHDRWTVYPDIPDSPIKEYDIDEWECDVAFIRDWDGRLPINHRFPVFPLDYGIERRYTEACSPYLDLERKVEIVFYGTLSTARRKYYLDKIKDAKLPITYGQYAFTEPDDKWSKWVYGRYTHNPKYYEELCKYMFAFCPYGAGYTCFRHAEAYAAGCIPVIQKPLEDIVSYHTFVDGINCILWETEEELIEKLSYWMKDVEGAKRLRKRCYEHGQNYMTSGFLANYILEKIRV